MAKHSYINQIDGFMMIENSCEKKNRILELNKNTIKINDQYIE